MGRKRHNADLWGSGRYFRAVGRPLRHLEAGAYYHIGIRGNNHAPIVVDDGDRIVFFHILRRVERRYGWRTHVRCLMGNHYHLLVETPLPNLADGMRDLNGGYARAFNERHKRKDHVFGRRYWSKVIESDEQYEATVEYIVNNPLHQVRPPARTMALDVGHRSQCARFARCLTTPTS